MLSIPNFNNPLPDDICNMGWSYSMSSIISQNRVTYTYLPLTLSTAIVSARFLRHIWHFPLNKLDRERESLCCYTRCRVINDCLEISCEFQFYAISSSWVNDAKHNVIKFVWHQMIQQEKYKSNTSKQEHCIGNRHLETV